MAQLTRTASGAFAPADFAQRLAVARQGYGCRPHAKVRFHLQHDKGRVSDIASED